MVVEYIRYRVSLDRYEEFERGWSEAQQVSREAWQCESYEVSRGVEEPENYVVRIEWSSVEEHEQGFRGSAAFGQFSQAVKPFSSRSRRCATTNRRASGAADEQA